MDKFSSSGIMFDGLSDLASCPPPRGRPDAYSNRACGSQGPLGLLVRPLDES